MNTPKIDIIVSRHPSFVAYLIEVGLASAATPVKAHVGRDDIEGLHVLGVLPYHLGCRARSVTEIPMRLQPDDRTDMQRGDLSIERVRQVAGPPRTYRVTDTASTTPAARLAEAFRLAIRNTGIFAVPKVSKDSSYGHIRFDEDGPMPVFVARVDTVTQRVSFECASSGELTPWMDPFLSTGEWIGGVWTGETAP